MAIIYNKNKEQYDMINAIINEVLSNRKFKFDINTIITNIKEKAKSLNIDNDILNCSYFYILVLDTVDKYVDEGKIYKNGKIFIPVDFMICVDYFPEPMRLIYYSKNKNNDDSTGTFIDIATLEIVPYNSIFDYDFILCGDCCNLINGEYTVILQSDVSLEEISNLYKQLIMEGASIKEAMVCILNHYKINSLSHNLYFDEQYIIQKPQIKRLTRKKNIHN